MDPLERLYRDRYIGYRNALAPIVGGADVARDVVQGASWALLGYLDGDGRLSCFSVGRTEALLAAPTRCRIHLMTPPGMSTSSGTAPVTVLGYPHRGGQIVFGSARTSVTRVTVMDTRGRTFTAAAVTAPTLPRPVARFRLWLVPLPSSRAISVFAYDRKGTLLYRGRPPGLPQEASDVH